MSKISNGKQTDKFLLMTENHTRFLAPLYSHFRLKVASLVLYLVEFCKKF